MVNSPWDLALLPWGRGDLRHLWLKGLLQKPHPCEVPQPPASAPHSQQELINQPSGHSQEGRDGLGKKGHRLTPGLGTVLPSALPLETTTLGCPLRPPPHPFSAREAWKAELSGQLML